jgi:glutaredoxin
MKMRHLVACCAALAACAALAQTNVYRWVDKDGKVQYSSEPPPSDAANVTQKRMGSSGGDDSSLPYATREAAKRNPVTLYVSNNCGELCADGRALLGNRGVPYAERNAEANPADADKLKQIAGALQVPLLMVGDRPVKGFDASVWHSALDGAGYPRTRLPGQVANRPAAPEAPAEAAAPK